MPCSVTDKQAVHSVALASGLALSLAVSLKVCLQSAVGYDISHTRE